MENKDFQFSFISSWPSSQVFAHLINPQNWWKGIFGEKITGQSAQLNDEFTFSAGDGLHYSVQKLLAMEANKKLVWLVTESNLSFLKDTNEWAGTKICFDIEEQNNQTKITFTHQGLVPPIECYEACSGAWTQYMQNLKKQLQ